MTEYTEEIPDPAKGKLRYLRPFIVLVPSLIVCIFNIVVKLPLMESMWRLLFTVIFFFIVGSIAQGVVRYILLHPDKAPDEEDEESDEEQEEAENEEEEDADTNEQE